MRSGIHRAGGGKSRVERRKREIGRGGELWVCQRITKQSSNTSRNYLVGEAEGAPCLTEIFPRRKGPEVTRD